MQEKHYAESMPYRHNNKAAMAADSLCRRDEATAQAI